MTTPKKARLAGGICIAGATGVAAVAVALLGPAAHAATKGGGSSTGTASANGGSGSSPSVVETPVLGHQHRQHRAGHVHRDLQPGRRLR